MKYDLALSSKRDRQVTEGERNGTEKPADSGGSITEESERESERERKNKSGVILRAKTTWNPLPGAPSGTPPHHRILPLTVLMMSYYSEPLWSPT